MKNKILLLLFVNIQIFASTCSNSDLGTNVAAKLYKGICNSKYTIEFYFLMKLVAFILFMYAFYNGFVSDNQQKTRQQTFFGTLAFFVFSGIFANFEGFLLTLGSK
jgi:hypothetical protein